MSHKKSPRVLFTFLALVGIFSAAYIFANTNVIRPLSGIGGEIYSTDANYHWGTFRTDDGNPGKIEFGLAPTDSGSYSGAALISNDSGSTLSGYFWIGTIGWVSLENVDFIKSGSSATAPYTLSGWIWSDYAGWIDLSDTGHVEWDPANTTFSGFAWNDGIGWINMAGASLESTSSGLIGKVKVLGNLGGLQIVDTTYTIKNTSVQGTTTMNSIINSVHKNVALTLRNLPTTRMNTDFTTANPNTYKDSILFVNSGSTSKYVSFNKSQILSKFTNITAPVRSLIVVGGDIYLDEAVVNQSSWPSGWADHPRAIIALKNDQGVGGNIYIHGSITRIMSSLVAEGSLFSVPSDMPTNGDTTLTLSNHVETNLLTLPDRQLYINGSIISHNTIGGSYGLTSSFVCPYVAETCDATSSIKYDFNYFRDFQKNKQGYAALRGYKDDTYNDYSVVIEYDPRVLSDTPPGLATAN